MNGPRIDPRDASPPRWIAYPTGLAPLARLRPGTQFVDDGGTTRRLAGSRYAFEIGRRGLFVVLDSLLRAVLWLLGAGDRPTPARMRPRGNGPLLCVLPVLPDLSHTFVYREVAALLELRDDVLLVALERGTTLVVHAEAEALFARARFLQRRGVLGRSAVFLRTLFRHPLRLRALAALFRGESGGAGAGLLGKLPLREARHPGRALELAAAVEALRPSEIHVYGSTWSANVAMGASILLDVPFSISSYVDFEFDYAHKQLDAKFARARFFRVCTEDCRRRLLRLLGTTHEAIADRVLVLHWGIDADRLRARAAAPPPLAELPRLQLLSACRVVAKKAVHLVPEVLARLRALGIDARWTLVGDGPELPRVREAALRHGVDAHCSFVGPLPNEQVVELIERSDLAILPCVETSDGERDGIPVFLIEAMALGRLVVTTPVSGIPELIVDGVTGALADAEPSALADRILALLGRRSEAQAIAERGRARALEEDCRIAARGLEARLRQTPN